MEITVSQEQGQVPVTVLHITGDIDADTYKQLEAQSQQAIQNGAHYMVLDMTKVPYVSSYGIRAISQIFTWLRDSIHGEDDAALSHGLRDGTFKSHHLKLAGTSQQVMKVLSMTGVDMFLKSYNSVKEAIASFSLE